MCKPSQVRLDLVKQKNWLNYDVSNVGIKLVIFKRFEYNCYDKQMSDFSFVSLLIISIVYG